MARRSVVSSRILRRLPAAVWPSRITIEQSTDTIDAYGDEVRAPWAPLAGHVGIECRVAPRVGSREMDLNNQVRSDMKYIIHLKGHYPGIHEKMRGVVGSNVYNIEIVEHDGNGITTHLFCEIDR